MTGKLTQCERLQIADPFTGPLFLNLALAVTERGNWRGEKSSIPALMPEDKQCLSSALAAKIGNDLVKRANAGARISQVCFTPD